MGWPPSITHWRLAMLPSSRDAQDAWKAHHAKALMMSDIRHVISSSTGICTTRTWY